MVSSHILDLRSDLKNLLKNGRISLFRDKLEKLPLNDKFQLLSQADGEGNYLLHDVLYSICDPQRTNIPGNNPTLITSVLSGLRRKQRVHLLCLCNVFGFTPFSVLASHNHLSEEVYLTAFRKLCARLTQAQKFQALQSSQRGLGHPMEKLVCDYSKEALSVIRERLHPWLFAKLLATPHENLGTPLVRIMEKGNLDFLEACLEGITGEYRVALITSWDDYPSPIARAVQSSSPDIIKILLSGLTQEQRLFVYQTRDQAQISPKGILRKSEDPIIQIVSLFNRAACCHDATITADFNAANYDPSGTMEPYNHIIRTSDLGRAISGRSSEDPRALIKELTDPDLWIVIGKLDDRAVRPIDRAISREAISFLDEVERRTPVSVMKSLLMDGNGGPCFSLLNLIKSNSVSRVPLLETLLRRFEREDRQELFNAVDRKGVSIASLLMEKAEGLDALRLYFASNQPSTVAKISNIVTPSACGGIIPSGPGPY